MTKKNNNCDSCAQKGSCKDQNDGQECTCKVDRMARIKHKIIIASGKGGVGKSTVSVNLARALQMKGLRVGILDARYHRPGYSQAAGNRGGKAEAGAGGN